jgi:hypothetical protein
VPKRSIGQLFIDFLENANDRFLKIRVKLSGRSSIIVENFIECHKNTHENIV